MTGKWFARPLYMVARNGRSHCFHEDKRTAEFQYQCFVKAHPKTKWQLIKCKVLDEN